MVSMIETCKAKNLRSLRKETAFFHLEFAETSEPHFEKKIALVYTPHPLANQPRRGASYVTFLIYLRTDRGKVR